MRVLALLLLLASPAWAGRDFDGANDEIDFGSDASLDNFAIRGMCMWVRLDDTAAVEVLFTKGAAAAEYGSSASANDSFRYVSDWTSDGTWVATTDVIDGTWKYLCINYNNGATSNDANLLLNCVQEILSTDTNPTGSWTVDAANNLQLGETNADAQDFDGGIAAFIYHDAAFAPATCNRNRWWGRGIGGLVVYHPFWTSKLTNEGTGTANGTATGTTVQSSPIPVVRPGIGLMNGGIGW